MVVTEIKDNSGYEHEIGDIRQGKEIGFKSRTDKFIWYACEVCGKQRWVTYIVHKSKPKNTLCQKCACNTTDYKNKQRNSPNKFRYGKDNLCWKGGKTLTADGYVVTSVLPSDFYRPMADKFRRILEHRLIMAQILGRCLHTWELVHHKNGIKNDNRLENLEILIRGQHLADHSKGYKDGFEKGYREGLRKGLNEQIKNNRNP